mgnify:CR=1 FL=1
MFQHKVLLRKELGFLRKLAIGTIVIATATTSGCAITIAAVFAVGHVLECRRAAAVACVVLQTRQVGEEKKERKKERTLQSVRSIHIAGYVLSLSLPVAL